MVGGRRVRWILGGAAALLVGVFVAGASWLASPRGEAFVLDQLQSLAADSLAEGRLELEGIDIQGLHGATLRGMRLLDGTDREVASLSLEVEVSLAPLLWREVRLGHLRLRDVYLDFQTGEDRQFSIQKMLPASEGEGTSGWDVVVEALEIEGEGINLEHPDLQLPVGAWGVAGGVALEAGVLRWRGLTVQAEAGGEVGEVRLATDGMFDGTEILLEALDVTAREAKVHVEGTVADLEGVPRLQGKLQAENLRLASWEDSVGVEGLSGALALALEAKGTVQSLVLTGRLETEAGQVSLAGTLGSLDAVPAWSLLLGLEGLDPAAHLAGLLPSSITGTVSLEGTGWFPQEGFLASLDMEEGLALEQPFHGVKGKVRGVDGGFALESLEVDCPLGLVGVSGTWKDNGFSGHVNAQASNLSRLEAVGVTGFSGAGSASGSVRATLGNVPVVQFEGEVAAEGVRGPENVRLRSASGPVDLVWRDGRVDASGRTRARALETDQARLGDALLEWEGFYAPDGSFDLDARVKAGGFEGGGLRVGGLVGSLSARANSPLSVDLDMQVRAVTWQNLKADAGRVRLVLSPSGEADVSVSLTLAGKPLLDLQGVAWPEEGRLEVETLALSPPGYDAWQLTEPARATWMGTTQGAAFLSLVSPSGRLRVEAAVEDGPLTADVEVSGLVLSWLEAVLPVEGWSGVTSGQFHLGGTLENLLVEGRLEARELFIPNTVEGLGFAVDFTNLDGVARVEGVLSDERAPMGRVQAGLPLGFGLQSDRPSVLGIEGLWLEPDAPMEIHGVLDPVGLRRLGALMPGVQELPKGRVGAEVRVGGTPSKPRMTLASSLDVRLGEVPDRARVDLDVLLREGRFEVGGLVMQQGVRRLRVEGQAATRIEALLSSLWDETSDPPWGDINAWVGALELEVVPMAVPLSALQAFVPVPEGLQGFLGGGFQVGGTGAHPTLAGAVQVIDGRLGDLALAPALVAVSPMEGAFKVMGLFGLGEGSLEFAGRVPFDFDADFDLDKTLQREGLAVDVWGRGVPLGALTLVDPGIRNAEGRLAISGHVGGSLLEPAPKIQLSLEGGRLDYPPLGIGMRDLAFQADTTPDAMRLLTVSGSSRSLVGSRGRKGSLTAEGEIPFPWRGDAGMSIHISLDDLLLADLPELEVVMAGGVQIAGSWPDLGATGAVELVEANVVVDENVWLSQATMALNPDVRIHRESVVLAEGARGLAQGEWWESLVADVEVDLGNNTWGEALVPLDVTYGAVSSVFRTVAAKGRVRGRVRVKGTIEDALVEGQLETERATAVVFGSEFQVERGGVIRFTGTDYTNPEVDLTAVHETTQYGDVSVDISGTLEALTLAFRSSVGLNEKDIAALLLLGRPTSELGEGEGSLVGAAVGAMAGRAESIGLGDWVDLFQLDTEGEAISAYTVGKAVGDKAFLSYSRDFYAEMDENQAELTLEVFFTRNVHAQVVAGDRGQSSADLFLRWRF